MASELLPFIEAGDYSSISFLLERKKFTVAQLNDIVPDTNAPLFFLAVENCIDQKDMQEDRLKIVELLLNAGADPNVFLDQPDLRTTPLCFTVYCGRFDLVKILLNSGADPLWFSQTTPPAVAIAISHPELFQYVLDWTLQRLGGTFYSKQQIVSLCLAFACAKV